MGFIDKLGGQVASAIGLGGSRSGRKKTMRYGVFVRGRKVSSHSTKRLALKRARPVRGARVRKLRRRK